MDTLEYIINKYNIDIAKESPFCIQCERWKRIPKLFAELGFKVGAEIGVYRGRYTMYLLERIPGVKVYAVDLWRKYGAYRDFKSEDIINAEKEFREKVRGHNCDVFKGRSVDVVNQFANNSLDFVFIDGNHAYEYVVEDIAKWSKKVRKGGIIYGHDFDDYSKRGRWRDMNVINAVEGWMKSYKIHPWFVLKGRKNKCWMYVK